MWVEPHPMAFWKYPEGLALVTVLDTSEYTAVYRGMLYRIVLDVETVCRSVDDSLERTKL